MTKFFKLNFWSGVLDYSIVEFEGELVLDEDTGYGINHNGNWEPMKSSYVKCGFYKVNINDCFERLEDAKAELKRRITKYKDKDKLSEEIEEYDNLLTKLERLY